MPTTATEIAKARVHEATFRPASSWTAASATTGGNGNIGPGALRRLEITTHFPTSTAASGNR